VFVFLRNGGLVHIRHFWNGGFDKKMTYTCFIGASLSVLIHNEQLVMKHMYWCAIARHALRRWG
jgi:hypothetical protein